MALYMVFIEDVEDKDGERCIMPTSEHLEDMVVLAWQTGAYVFCFVDRAQHLAMMKSIGMYDERLNSDEKATYFFTGENPQWERDKPTGMKLCDYLYRKVERFAIENGVQVVDAGKCSPEQINAMIEVVSERHGESAVNEKLKAELMREYNSRYFNVPVPELPEDKPARRWWPFGKITPAPAWPVLLFFPELIPHHLPECFRILVKPFAHVGRGIHVQLVQLFQQQQRLILNEFSHIEGSFFLLRHVLHSLR